MNNGVRIVIDRREGNRWYWKLTAYGVEYRASGSEATAAKAAAEAQSQLWRVEFSKQKAG
jgi:hypothetical protein